MSAERFGEYEVLKREDGSLFELGRGAMGVTYKAFDTDLHRFVALKMISPAAMAHPEAEERFMREARSAAQLRHPNIAGIFRRDKTPEGTHYYAMEFCEGRTIDQLVKQEGPLEWRRALEISAQAANALAAAARGNLIHRDIKPANLMLVREAEDEGEVLKVIDFGLAKKAADDGTAWSSMGTQGFVGTAHFSSPEQIQNGIVDTRSDIYSLGATLWFMLRGSPPFAGSIWEVISKHVTATPDFSLLSGAPESVVDLVRQMMEKNPADRPQTARELLEKIKECLHPEPAPEVESALNMAPVRDVQPVSADWTPSLKDLLRARRELEAVEAWRLGEKLAALLDEEHPAGALNGALLIQRISIHFRDPLSESDARAKLRETVTAWPPFDLSIDASKNPAEGETVVVGDMKTIITAVDLAGDRVQQLARVLYELLGGVLGSEFAPLGSSGEEGNEVLQLGIGKGTEEYPRARDLVEALRVARMGSPAPRPESQRERSVSRAESRYPPNITPIRTLPRRSAFTRTAHNGETSKGKKWIVAILVIIGAAVASTYLLLFPTSVRVPEYKAAVSSPKMGDTPKAVEVKELETRRGNAHVGDISLKMPMADLATPRLAVTPGITLPSSARESGKLWVPAAPPARVELAPVYRGTIRAKDDSFPGKVPLVIRLEAGLKSGTMTQTSRHGDTIVRFNGVWDGTILRAVSGELVSKPPKVQWEPESFTLRFSDDGKTAHYESQADNRAYVAELAAQSTISGSPAQVYKGIIHSQNDSSGLSVPLTIKFEEDRKSGTLTESSKRGDTTVRFSGVWEASTLRAVTGNVVTIPENVRWTPETFSLTLSEDAATASYECRAEGRTYTATLVAP
jgi:serine/threonine protein kinase